MAIGVQAQAEDRHFIGLPNGGSATWNDDANWSGATVPTTADVAWLMDADAQNRTVTLDITTSINGLIIGNSLGGITTLYQNGSVDLGTPYESLGAFNAYSEQRSRGGHVQDGGTNNVGTLHLGAYTSSGRTLGTYTLNAGTLNVLTLGVGAWGYGTFEQNGGAVKAEGMGIGGTQLTTGVYMLNGGLLEVPYETVGFSGAGTFFQSGGSHVVTDTLWVSYAPGNTGGGIYLLSGAGANLIAANEYIGRGGITGVFVQSAGTHVVQSQCVVGYTKGSYDLSGGNFNVLRVLEIGLFGSGTINQSGGNASVGTKLNPGFLVIGETRGFYNLTGILANLTVWGTEYVGYDGWGTFYHSAGSHYVTEVLDIGGRVVSGQASYYQLEGGSLSVASEVVVGVYGPGRFTQSGGSFSTPLLTIGSGGTFTYSGGSFSVPAVSLSGRMTVEQGSDSTLSLNLLKITPFSAGALDVSNNALVINYTGLSPLSTIQQYLADARLFSSAAIPGVTGLGYAETASSVRVAYTYMGDTDLDGVVDLLDFANFLTGFAAAESSPLWFNGNFDYNVVVDLNDFALYLRGYYALGGSTEGITNAVNNAPLPESNRQSMVTLIATVPEPSAFAILALGAANLMRRERRRLDDRIHRAVCL